MSAIELNDKRQIVIDLSWLLGALTTEQKRELADSLACEEAIIEDVAAQLLTGWTDRSSHGAKSCSGDATTALDKARRELSSRAGEVAAEEIRELKRVLTWVKACEKHYQEAYFRLYHAWPIDSQRHLPQLGHVKAEDSLAYEVVKKATA